MKYAYAVVDKINTVEGNLFTNLVIAVDTDEGIKFYDMNVDIDYLNELGTVNRSPVFVTKSNFYLGELIIMQGEGERDYLDDRKPSKWDVNLSFFEDIERAIAYSIKVYTEAKK